MAQPNIPKTMAALKQLEEKMSSKHEEDEDAAAEEEWNQVLADMGQSDEKLLARYDIAIHVTSCAQGLSYMYDVPAASARLAAGCRP